MLIYFSSAFDKGANYFMKIIMKKTTCFVRELVSGLRNACAPVNRSPIIIVGNQKTGSTAIASLLAKATGLTLSQDFLFSLNPPGQCLLLKYGVALETVVEKNKQHFSQHIIKELDLVFLMDQIYYNFPAAKIVCLIRDPRDNIRSILNRLEIRGDWDALPLEVWKGLPNVVWTEVLKGSIYGFERENYIETLAGRWCNIVSKYEEHAQHVHLIRYEDFFENKLVCINHLAHLLGLEITNDISNFVDVQYQPRGDRDISLEDFFGEQNLAQIEAICGDKMKDYGYKFVGDIA